MTTHKEVMQQALILFEQYYKEEDITFAHCAKMIDALRDALAEPEVIRSEEGTKEGNPVDEPVAWYEPETGCVYEHRSNEYRLPLYLRPQRRLSDEDKLEARQPEVKEMIKKLRSPAQVFYEYKCDSGLQLTDAADLIERLATARPTCAWKSLAGEYMPDTFEGTCGVIWSFTDGGIAENEVNFCPRCGGKIDTAQGDASE